MRRGRAMSLQARLGWRLLAVFIGGLALGIGGLAWKAIVAIDSLQDRSLQAQAADIVRYLSRGPDGAVTLSLPADLAAAYERSGGAYLYVIYAGDGAVLFASGPEAPALLRDHVVRDARQPFFEIKNPTGIGPFYGYAMAHGGVTVAVAQGSLHDDVLADSLIEEFVEYIGWWLVPVVAVTLWVGVMTIRTSLAPLTKVSAQAARIGPDRADIRLAEDALPGEIRPLVAAVNSAFDRLEAGFEAQRRFTADAAHELRTPLAVLTARIDGLGDDDVAQALRGDVRRMNRLVEQLLRVARLDTVPLDVSQVVDLRQITREVIAGLAPLALARRRDLALTGAEAPVEVFGNAAALAAAITNLIENALIHTPAGNTVEVELGEDGAVRVLDRGPGVAAAEREAIFRRFARGRGAHAPGAGLGLAIVLETARAHGGTVEVSDRPDGGAIFALRLRRAA